MKKLCVIMFSLISGFLGGILVESKISISDLPRDVLQEDHAQGGVGASSSVIADTVVAVSIKKTPESLSDILDVSPRPLDRYWEFKKLVERSDSSARKGIASELLENFAQGRVSRQNLSFYLAILGEFADESLADYMLNHDGLESSNVHELQEFVVSWASNQPDLALDFFSERDGGLLGTDGFLVKSLFEGMLINDPDFFLGARESIPKSLVPKLGAAWGSSLVQKFGYEKALDQIQAAADSGDTIARDRVIPHMRYSAIKAGILPALNAAINAEGDPNASLGFGMTFGSYYPQEALDWVASLDVDHPSRAMAANGVMASVAKKDPVKALDFAASFQGSREQQIELLSGMSSAFLSSNQENWAHECQVLIEELVDSKSQ